MVLRPNEVDRRFLLYALLSDGFIKLVDSSTYGAKMPRANWEFIGSMRTPVPSPDEQQAIARFLDEQTTKIDKVTQETITAIDRLTEYRTALISAAVTGKIDVRGGAA
jgi:restriction endonuclease S subunit